MNSQKQKGDREERAIVMLHKQLGFECQRTLEGGARSDGSDTYDIDLYLNGPDEAAVIGECKVRASGFKQLYDWLGDNNFLTVRADKKERLYVVPEWFWKELITKK
jgi:hypothetical protein